MAVDIFLRLDGVTGEAQDSVHQNEIDILSWSWGMSQSGTTHMGSGGGTGKVSVQDLSLTKYIDASSPTLQKFCANGQHVATGTLTMRKAGAHPLEYLKIDFQEIIISSVSTGGASTDERQTEHISLNFREFHTTYTPQQPDGTAGATVEASWNIAENTEA